MPRPGKQTTERAKDFKGTLRQLLSALRQYKLSLIVVMVFAILSTIFNIAGPKILAKATTALGDTCQFWCCRIRHYGTVGKYQNAFFTILGSLCKHQERT